MDIKILPLKKKHKDFILYANNIINNINSTYQTNNLEKNIDKDYFSNSPKFNCLVAETNERKSCWNDFVF